MRPPWCLVFFFSLSVPGDARLPGGSACKESESVSHSVVSNSLRPQGLPMGFSRQELWSELPLPSAGDLPDLGIEPRSPALQAESLPSELPGKASL